MEEHYIQQKGTMNESSHKERKEALRAKWMPLLDKVIEEIMRQDDKWGADRDLHPFCWNTILMEEVGEVSRASLEGNDEENYRDELIQVAAVAMQAYNNSTNGSIHFGCNEIVSFLST